MTGIWLAQTTSLGRQRSTLRIGSTASTEQPVALRQATQCEYCESVGSSHNAPTDDLPCLVDQGDMPLV